jgi:hypothetical protein
VELKASFFKSSFFIGLQLLAVDSNITNFHFFLDFFMLLARYLSRILYVYLRLCLSTFQ